MKNDDQSNSLDVTAHQLRIPLARNKWMLDMLLHGGDVLSEKQHDLVQRIILDNDRALTLIDEMLNPTDVKTSREAVRVSEILNQIISEIRPDAEKKHITFNIAADEVPELLLDKKNMTYVFENILVNAILYSRENTEIIVRVYRAADQVCVSVTDTGIGIPVAEQEQVFTKFYRGSNASKDVLGHGLGLSLAKQIVEQHTGTIRFDSIQDSGTTFFICLPIMNMS